MSLSRWPCIYFVHLPLAAHDISRFRHWDFCKTCSSLMMQTVPQCVSATVTYDCWSVRGLITVLLVLVCVFLTYWSVSSTCLLRSSYVMYPDSWGSQGFITSSSYNLSHSKVSVLIYTARTQTHTNGINNLALFFLLIWSVFLLSELML